MRVNYLFGLLPLLYMLLACGSDIKVMMGGFYKCQDGHFTIEFPEAWLIAENLEDNEVVCTNYRKHGSGVPIENITIWWEQHESPTTIQEVVAYDSAVWRADARFREFRDSLRAGTDAKVDTVWSTVGDMPALKIVGVENPRGLGHSLGTLSYRFVIGRWEYRILCATAADSMAAHQSVFETVVSSFRHE